MPTKTTYLPVYVKYTSMCCFLCSGSRENIDQARMPLYEGEDDRDYYPEKPAYSSDPYEQSGKNVASAPSYGQLNKGKSGSTTDTFV